MNIKQVIRKNYWMLLLGLAALVIGEITGVGGFFAGGFGCLLVFAYEIFKELCKRSDSDD